MPHCLALGSLLSPCLLLAATKTNAESIPPLRPPRAEMPPSFWEQHGAWVILSGIVLLGLLCAAVWWLRRAQPQATVPPEVQARQALERLRNQPEDGALLSRASQVLRRYIIQAFALPPNELTTTEFCNVINGTHSVGPQFSAAISEFLRCCDQRKFAPSADSQPFDEVSQALRLIELGEARRAELRQAEQTSEAAKP